MFEIAGADAPVEIQITSSDRAQLEELASTFCSDDASPSAGQVGGVLLSLALETIKANPATTNEPLAQKLAEKVVSKA